MSVPVDFSNYEITSVLPAKLGFSKAEIAQKHLD